MRYFFRRPFYFLFILMLIISFSITSIVKESNTKKEVILQGIIKEEFNGKYQHQYRIKNLFLKTNKKLVVGEYIEIQGIAESLDFEDNSYHRYLKARGIDFEIKNPKIVLLEKRINIYGIGESLRRKIGGFIDQGYRKESYFFRALFLGDTSSMDKDVYNTFKDSGTAHVIALSGLHVGLLAGILEVLLFFFGKKSKSIIIIGLMLLYSLIGGLRPSIIRAVIFLVMYYICFFIRKPFDILNSAGLIGIIYLLKNPWIIYDPGFVLSFFGVSSIGMYAWYFKKYLKYDVLVITFAAQILIWPIIYYQFKMISLVSLISNLLIVPIMSFCLFSFILTLGLEIIAPGSIMFSASIPKMLFYLQVEINKLFLSIPKSVLKFEKVSFIIFLFGMTFGLILGIYLEIKSIKENKYEIHRFYEKRQKENE